MCAILCEIKDIQALSAPKGHKKGVNTFMFPTNYLLLQGKNKDFLKDAKKKKKVPSQNFFILQPSWNETPKSLLALKKWALGARRSSGVVCFGRSGGVVCSGRTALG